MGIGAASAKIARHVFADLRVRPGVTFPDAGDGGHDLPRRAIAALESVLLQEGSLDRMQIIAGGSISGAVSLVPPFCEQNERSSFHDQSNNRHAAGYQ